MADEMVPTSVDALARWIDRELTAKRSVFGLPAELFFRPQRDDALASRFVGHRLETPMGVAAGPHTQMAQNIVTAYLAGARFIELKTVQTLDALEVTKPCIDMEDLGYNCEWSQELRLTQSFDEYLKAWILLHGLRERFGWGRGAENPGFVFNMSVGYDLRGVQKDNVQHFLRSMKNARQRRQELMAPLRSRAGWDRLLVPNQLSDSVTLSTMHGCPPEEIERIARYLIEELGLHTSIKLNPTLLGKEHLRQLLHDELGFDVDVPDAAFEHDPAYDDAVAMIRSLVQVARSKGLFFGLKLTNTLESRNVRHVLPHKEKMHYMSGRALHPLGVALAHRLSEEFDGQLPMSFAGGADAFNLTELIAANLTPVTFCTDLLKPGGYGRLKQALDILRDALAHAAATSPSELVCKRALADETCRRSIQALLAEQAAAHASTYLEPREWTQFWDTFDASPGTVSSRVLAAADAVSAGAEQAVALEMQLLLTCARVNLASYAATVHNDSRYKKTRRNPNTKTLRPLLTFDCVAAPCQEGCPAGQNIPAYMRLVREGRYDDAMRVVRETNPLPSTTGCACDHPCMAKCVRTHYDAPVAIRETKRFIVEQASRLDTRATSDERLGVSVAVVGAGPAGLAAAHYLALTGFDVTVFDQRQRVGGVPAAMIPTFRLPDEALAHDIDAITRLGAEFRFGVRIGQDVSVSELRAQHRYVFLGIGASKGISLGLPGEDAKNVHDCLELLAETRQGTPPTLGKSILVVGGGNSAMDAARTAWRLAGTGARVTLVYRRSLEHMPANDEEIRALADEGIAIRELLAPKEILLDDANNATGLVCRCMRLGEPDQSGRPRPVPMEGAEAVLEADSIIVAIGQRPATDALGETGIDTTPAGAIAVDPATGETSVPSVFAGGDITRGGSSIIQAAADARRAVSEMARREGRHLTLCLSVGGDISPDQHLTRRALRIYPEPMPELPQGERSGFEQVTLSLGEAQAEREAARCLGCDDFCSLCVTVCPNRANQSYASEPFAANLPIVTIERNGAKQQPGRPFRVEQPIQIINLADLCNECGNCRTFCPTAGSPYQDKPRLCFDEQSFNREKRAYRLTRTKHGWRLVHKCNAEVHTLEATGGSLAYVSPKLHARLSEDFDIEELRPGDEAAPGDTCDLDTCAAMYVLGRSLVADASFLPGLSGPSASEL